MIDIQTMTPQDIHQAGIEALARELGVVGMIRFLQQYERGVGDYSVERHAWLDEYTTEDIARLVAERRPPVKR